MHELFDLPQFLCCGLNFACVCLSTGSQSPKATCPPSSVCPSKSQRWGTFLWVFSLTSLLSSPPRCFTTKRTQRSQPSCQAVALTGQSLTPQHILSSFPYDKFSGNLKLCCCLWHYEIVTISIWTSGVQKLWLRGRTWILFTAPSSVLNPMRATWNLWQGYSGHYNVHEIYSKALFFQKRSKVSYLHFTVCALMYNTLFCFRSA